MVSLHKNQTVSLTKTASTPLNHIAIGLGWDPLETKKPGLLCRLFGCKTQNTIDLDAACVLFDADKEKQDIVFFAKLKSDCQSVTHRGDNLTGEGNGDDEVIDISLTNLPSNVSYLVITVSSFKGQNFNEVKNAFCRVMNTDDEQKELCRYDLSEQGEHTGIVIAILTRKKDNDWHITASGMPCDGLTVESMLPSIQNALPDL